MIKKIKNLILVAMTGSALFAPMVVPAFATAPVFADNITSGVCNGVSEAANGSNGSCGTAGSGSTVDLSTVAKKIINILSIIVGIIAVVMIIYGGFKYITSGGDTGNVSAAKNTLIFAIVGLIIVALAQFIVHFVLNSATGALPGTGS